ncbi:hypothetical protein HT031_006148 [Scenedesmus sp. PABB004]|nr:hypothetical protein HT031_006148 [Scenedesmus sp. PABB004]
MSDSGGTPRFRWRRTSTSAAGGAHEPSTLSRGGGSSGDGAPPARPGQAVLERSGNGGAGALPSAADQRGLPTSSSFLTDPNAGDDVRSALGTTSTTSTKKLRAIGGNDITLHFFTSKKLDLSSGSGAGSEASSEHGSDAGDAEPPPRVRINTHMYTGGMTLMALAAVAGMSFYNVTMTILRLKTYYAAVVFIFIPLGMIFFSFAVSCAVRGVFSVILGGTSPLEINSQNFSAIKTPVPKGTALPQIIVQMPVYKEGLAEVIPPEEAVERSNFYAKHGIAFVARPPANRRGVFKKARAAARRRAAPRAPRRAARPSRRRSASPPVPPPHRCRPTAQASNLNYQLSVSDAIGQAMAATPGLSVHDALARVWEDREREFVPERCMYDVVGEFLDSPSVAYTQHYTTPFDDQCRNYWRVAEPRAAPARGSRAGRAPLTRRAALRPRAPHERPRAPPALPCPAARRREAHVSEFTRTIYFHGIAVMVAYGDCCPLVGHNAFLRWESVRKARCAAASAARAARAARCAPRAAPHGAGGRPRRRARCGRRRGDTRPPRARPAAAQIGYRDESCREGETKCVSEDFDMYIRLANIGAFGRYVMYTDTQATGAGAGRARVRRAARGAARRRRGPPARAGDEFQEGVSLTYMDEVIKARRGSAARAAHLQLRRAAPWDMKKFAYGACEMIFNPFRLWPLRGPFNRGFTTYLRNANIAWYQKASMVRAGGRGAPAAAGRGAARHGCSRAAANAALPPPPTHAQLIYLSSYLAMGAAFFYVMFEGIMSVIDPKARAGDFHDYFLTRSFDVMLTCTVVFGGLARRPRPQPRRARGLPAELPPRAARAVRSQVKFVPTTVLFFNSVLFPITEVVWGATAKETTRKSCWEALRETVVGYKWEYLLLATILVGYSVCLWYWQIGTYRGWALMQYTIGHLLGPILLNPHIMALGW